MAEDVWKRRFYVFVILRLLGLAVFMFGLAVVFTDVLRPGGWPAVGSVIVILGVIDAVLAPKLLRKQWDRLDREQQ